MKKVGLVIIVLLVLSILLFVIIGNKKSSTKDNSLQQENIMETKEGLKGAGVYNFDTNQSEVNWEGRKTLLKEWVDTGSISIQSGSITLNNGEITQSKVIMDMNSITAEKTGMGKGEDNLSKHLKSADFFNAEAFPTSEFTLTSLTPTGEKYTYKAKGEMTIKSTTKTIEFPITVYMENESIFIKGEVVLDRAQFDVRYGSTNFFNDLGDKAINNNFKLELNLVANKIN